jgi:4-aminobutyrate aminotransferase
MMPGVVHLPYAYCYRCFANLKYPSCEIACAKYFVQKLNSPYSGIDDLGAIFIEPVQGEGGYINPPVEFIKIIKTACEKNGILFVADEVQCGAGRTGKMWGIEYYDVIPDMLVFGKGIGGDQPIAGVSVRNEYKNKLRLASHGNTFSENALGCAVAFANIEILTNPEWDLMGRAAKLGEEIKKAFHSFAEESPVIGDVRGKGLMIGIELVKDKNTREPISNIVDIINKACEKGLLMLATGRHRNVLRLAPSLIISQELLDKATHILVEVIKENESVLRT